MITLVTPRDYPVLVLRAVDGDSVAVGVDKGLGDWDFGADDRGLSLRLAGVNCREIAAPGGREARANTARLLGVGITLPTSVPFPLRATHRARVLDVDKYGGRLRATLELPGGADLSTTLLAEHWAAAYDGVGPLPLPPWPRPEDAPG